jgi:hypothetical protein
VGFFRTRRSFGLWADLKEMIPLWMFSVFALMLYEAVAVFSDPDVYPGTWRCGLVFLCCMLLLLGADSWVRDTQMPNGISFLVSRIFGLCLFGFSYFGLLNLTSYEGRSSVPLLQKLLIIISFVVVIATAILFCVAVIYRVVKFASMRTKRSKVLMILSASGIVALSSLLLWADSAVVNGTYGYHAGPTSYIVVLLCGLVAPAAGLTYLVASLLISRLLGRWSSGRCFYVS